MSLGIGASKACLQVQQVMDDIAGNNIPTLKFNNFGTLQWLTSTTNTSGFEGLANQDPGGKNRTVKISYWTNPRTAAGTSCVPNICTPGTTTAEKYAEMTMQYCRNVSLTLDEREFRDFCGDGVKESTFAQQQMKGVLNQLLDGISTDAVTYIATHAGNFYGSIAGPKDIILMKSDGSPYHGGETTVSNDLEDIGVMDTPAAVGQGFLRTYSKDKALACCNSTGIDLSKGDSTWIYFSEKRVDAVVADDNNFFVMAPGAVQLVTKVKWVGPYEDLRSENEAKTTINVAVPGGGSIPVDFTVYRSFCGGNNDGHTKWVLTWSANFDFFSLPPDTEAVDSPWRNVNGILQYNAICGTPGCADVNS